MNLVDVLRKFVDPRGQIGEFLSPSDVFKSRAGLPIDAPQRARAVLPNPPPVILKPASFHDVDTIDVPKSRMRVVSAYVEEHFTPVYKEQESRNYHAILAAGMQLDGWIVEQKLRKQYCDCTNARLERDVDGKLVHRACGRAKTRVADSEFAQHILNIQIAPSDEFYNTYYETIPGDDPVVLDGKVLKGTPVWKDGKMVHDGTIRGGTQMTRGRREWREKTKGWVLWDKGVVKERDKAYAEYQKKFIDGVRPRVKALSRLLPRKVGEL
jgi:hypothetical protein